MVPMTGTGPEVYVATMTNVISNYYDYLVDTLNHMKSLKLKDNLGGGGVLHIIVIQYWYMWSALRVSETLSPSTTAI